MRDVQLRLLLLAEFLVDHGTEIGEDLVLPFVPLLSVEHCQSSPEGGKGDSRNEKLTSSLF